jgi:hypothetical protein
MTLALNHHSLRRRSLTRGMPVGHLAMTEKVLVPWLFQDKLFQDNGTYNNNNGSIIIKPCLLLLLEILV